MKTNTYLKFFETEDAAMDWMRSKNRACVTAGNHKDLFVVTDGPEDNYAVMDVKSAICLGTTYKWEI